MARRRKEAAVDPRPGHAGAIVAEMLDAAHPDRGVMLAEPSIPARPASLGVRRPVEVPIRSPIHTPRFSLRALEVRDRAEFVRVLIASPHVDAFMPLRHEHESAEACFARHLATARNGDASGRCWRRVAVDPDGRIVGGFNLIHIERGLAYRGDATWWVAGDVLRQGIGTEGVYAMLDHALGDAPEGLGLHEVHAHVQVENHASLRLATRVGMRPTGQPQALQVGGRWLLHQTFGKSVLDRA